MALIIKSVTKTNFGEVKGNVGMYTGGNVDEILTDLASQIDAKLTSAIHYKGNVATYDALPVPETDATGKYTTVVEIGDLYNVTATGKNYIAAVVTAPASNPGQGSVSWDEVSGVMDLSAYKTDAENENKYEQKANLDTDVGTAGYLKQAGVQSLINTSLEAYTKTADLGALAFKSSVAKSDLASALSTELDAKATTEALNAVDAKFADYTKTADLGALATKDTVAKTDLATALANELDAKATSADLTTLAGRVTTAEGNITTAQGDITALKAKFTAIAGVVKATKSTVTLYELYDMVDAIIDAAKDPT